GSVSRRRPSPAALVVTLLAAAPAAAQAPPRAATETATDLDAPDDAAAPARRRGERIRIGVRTAAVGVVGSLALTLRLTLPEHTPRWGALGFDDRARRKLRLRAQATSDRVRLASDVLMYSSIALPLVIDTVSRILGRGHRLALLEDAETFISVALAIALVKPLARRARPLPESCEGDMSCDQAETDSFFSGHTAMSFAGAGLLCAEQEDATDLALCGLGLAMAGSTGLFRVLSDRHHVTDVLVGALVGFGIGYATRRLARSRDLVFAVAPEVRADGGGLGAMIVF
ncbi:MAG TPA: phosphatase PAP2 family protein, partial [Polyangiaceae bacterium LLY-WYZ-15_(1-7)]|nr:phosphatase PAP2 family protein [Polyangiaceae bacterium LLY-WYZ-15_(1-7)]